MTKYNFDEIIDRHNTNSLKWDFNLKRGMPADALPLWVADMDFRCPNEIIEALKDRALHGIFGYSEPYDDYYDVISNWIYNHHGYKPNPNKFVMSPSVVFAISNIIETVTKENDAIIINQPVYYPFSEVITMNNRKLIVNDLAYNDNKYKIDFDLFEKQIIDNKVKLFILCSPHNPVGRVWKKEELLEIAEICYRNNVFVISDEIHADFTYPGYKFISYGSLDDKYLDFAAICISATKPFNIAGLHNSNVYILNDKIRKSYLYTQNKRGYSQSNIMGIVASYAGYKYGNEWLTELKDYLYSNLNFVREFLNKYLPKVKLVEPEGTYLIWLDFKNLKISDKQLNDIIKYDAKIWLDAGVLFGKSGSGFERINIACPRVILEDALNRLRQALIKNNLV